jgi:hypothetical protein
VLSSHLISDLERACDYLIVLVDSRVRVAGPVDDLLATHHLLSGPRRDPASLPDGLEVISASHTDVQTTLLARTSGPVFDPAWTVSELGLEDLVLAYMKLTGGSGHRNLGPGGSPALDNCLASHGIRVAVSYQPVSRYWPLQFAETGLFLALALALAWYCFWRLNRRRS